ncbi:AMP-binding protein [Erythrobacter sp.]|uniref:class I adenylate-forming enzyme family protein n=1 Tax=Erythrobacter sp. TaxID=1042 RepID=UPI001B137AA5|nr:AMP-binding protein [Erythrobacter sp.]MBO6525423.1 AMP-binding protein [Erythrobacter sp.]MBO6529904.1 AMP-binding protein [Erythrobacter sp.]
MSQIADLIARSARQFGSKPCLVEGERVVSFADFDAATNRYANAFLALGLSQGDRVGVLLPNGIDCLLAYYGLAKAGLVRVSLNSRDTASDLRFKLAEVGARAVLVGADTPDLGVEIALPPGKVRASLDAASDDPTGVERSLDEPYRLGFTGGTTGRPKAVTLTERGELAELSAFLTDLVPDINADDRFLHAAPIAHASGAFFLPALVRGATSLVMAKFLADEFVALAASTRATITFLVPTMLAVLLEEPGLENAELTLRRIAYGASPIAPALYARAEERFGPIFAQTYGQAESPMVITCLKPDEHDRIGSCGRPFTLAQVAVMDDDGKLLPPGSVGEIVVKGPQLMARYWNREDATAEAFRGGWLHTGDIGQMDEDGFFYLLDRKGDMLISGGYNVYPREVEDVLLAFPGVVEAAVIGLPDEKWGERVHAVVSGHGIDTAALAAHAKAALADYKAPKSVEVWDTLPKSPANKILRRKVRRLVLEEGEVTV